MSAVQQLLLAEGTGPLANPSIWEWPAVNRDWVEQIVIDDADDLPLDLPWQEITYI